MATIYLPNEALEGMTSLERGKAVSHELWRLRRPASLASANDVAQYMFGWTIHPTTGQSALVAEETHEIYVNPAHTLDALLLLFPQIPEAERLQLVSYVNSNSEFPFVNIIPSTSVILTVAEATAAGWIEPDPIEE